MASGGRYVCRKYTMHSPRWKFFCTRISIFLPLRYISSVSFSCPLKANHPLWDRQTGMKVQQRPCPDSFTAVFLIINLLLLSYGGYQRQTAAYDRVATPFCQKKAERKINRFCCCDIALRVSLCTVMWTVKSNFRHVKNICYIVVAWQGRLHPQPRPPIHPPPPRSSTLWPRNSGTAAAERRIHPRQSSGI